MSIPTHHSRKKAAVILAERGIYPKQGVLHGLMYPMAFVAGMGVGTPAAGMWWVGVIIGVVVLAAGWAYGSSVDRRYDDAIAEVAGELDENVPDREFRA